MKRSVYSISILVTIAAIASSCLKSFDCTYDVYENEDFFVSAEIDGQQLTVRDTADNQVIPGMRYILDSLDRDSLIIYYDCYFLIDGGAEILLLSIVTEDDLDQVYYYGNNIINYKKFDSLVYEGDFQFAERIEDTYKHGVDVIYLKNDTSEYYIDTSQENPEDFSFTVDSYERNMEKDCYSRVFNWFTIDGTFSCRMVDEVNGDTIYIKNGSFRSAVSQYYFGSF